MKHKAILSLALFAVTGGFLGCSSDQYNRDRQGSYGGGPSFSGGCRDAQECRDSAEALATQIKAGDPKFEELYFEGMSLQDALADYMQHGYIKRSGVRILKLVDEGEGRLSAIVAIADTSGEPTTDHQGMDLRFMQAHNKDLELPIKGVSVLYEQDPASLHLGSVLDFSGSMSAAIPSLQKASAQLYGSLPKVKANITKFNSGAKVIVKDTSEQAAIHKAIFDDFELGSTALFDGILTGLQSLPKNSDTLAGINLQLVFTDGVENASRTSYESLKGHLRDYRIPQLVLGMGDVDLKSLITMAADTNGLFYYLPNADKMEASMAYVEKVIKSLVRVEIDASALGEVKLGEVMAKVKDK